MPLQRRQTKLATPCWHVTLSGREESRMEKLIQPKNSRNFVQEENEDNCGSCWFDGGGSPCCHACPSLCETFAVSLSVTQLSRSSRTWAQQAFNISQLREEVRLLFFCFFFLRDEETKLNRSFPLSLRLNFEALGHLNFFNFPAYPTLSRHSNRVSFSASSLSVKSLNSPSSLSHR